MRAYVCFAGLVAVCYAIAFSLRTAPWPLSDWLINFEGGFVRRGLPGESLLLVSRVLHVPLAWSVASLQIACILCLTVSLWWVAGKVFSKATPVWQKALLLSPATLGFFWFDPGLILRKEIALFAVMGLLILLLRQGSSTSDVMLAIFLSVSCPLLLFAHEGLVCYMPYVFALVALARQSLRSAFLVCVIPALLSLVPVLIAVHYPGDGATANMICRSVGGPATGLCTGPIYYIGISRTVYEAEVRSLMHDSRMMFAFGITTMLALLPVIAGLIDLWRKPVSAQTRFVLPACFAASALASTILFVEAQDWTRWIYIHMMCLMLVLFFAVMQRRSAELTTGPLVLFWRKRTAAAILLFLYATLWHLPEWVIAGAREYRPFGYESLLRRASHHSTEDTR